MTQKHTPRRRSAGRVLWLVNLCFVVLMVIAGVWAGNLWMVGFALLALGLGVLQALLYERQQNSLRDPPP